MKFHSKRHEKYFQDVSEFLSKVKSYQENPEKYIVLFRENPVEDLIFVDTYLLEAGFKAQNCKTIICGCSTSFDGEEELRYIETEERLDKIKADFKVIEIVQVVLL